MAGPSRRRPWLVALGAAAIVGVAAAALLWLQPDERVNNSSTPPASPSAQNGATALEPPPAESAVPAAVRYVASTGELFAHSPVGRREILRKLVTPEALADQVAALDDTAAAMSSKLAHPIEEYVWVEAPLTAGLEDIQPPGSVMLALEPVQPGDFP